jgi:hypothetical protein
MTVLIAWRIYRTRRFMPGGLGALLPIFIVIVESGTLYAISVLVLLVTLFAGSSAQCTVLDVVVPIVVSFLT